MFENPNIPQHMQFLGVYWMTNDHGGPRMSMIFYLALRSKENSFALDSLQKVNILKICVTTFGRMATSMVKSNYEYQIFQPNQGCYIVGSYTSTIGIPPPTPPIFPYPSLPPIVKTKKSDIET